MSNKDNGGPAFPCQYETYAPYNGHNQSKETTVLPGMTLRDYFAAKAMQSFMSWALNQNIFEGYESASDCAAAYAKHAYSIADAMLEARK